MSEHPLDPLSAAEFSAVTAILRRDRDVTTTPGSWRITGIEMAEPTKAELAAFEAGGPRPARRAIVLCLDRANNATYRSVVSLSGDRIESFEHVPGVQPNFTVDEFMTRRARVRRGATHARRRGTHAHGRGAHGARRRHHLVLRRTRHRHRLRPQLLLRRARPGARAARGRGARAVRHGGAACVGARC